MKASGRGGPADEREQREVVELVSKPELDRAQRQIERLQKENERRKRESERLKRESERLKQESDRLRQEIERLRKELEAALRAGKRQAAPHSRGELKANPKPPGRKAGRAYGRRACRPIPPRLDERIDVALPKRCPRCGGGVEVEQTAPQHQEEIVRRTVARRFDIAVGRCRRCGRRVQGRHPLQTSDALGAAASQLGPRALALAADLHTGLGLPLGKVSALFATAFGLVVTPGGLCLALHRVARRAEPTYRALVLVVRRARVAAADETGWKVGGWLQWLWVFVTVRVTVYAIQPGRGYEEAALILGAHFAGILNRDGWAPYRQF